MEKFLSDWTGKKDYIHRFRKIKKNCMKRDGKYHAENSWKVWTKTETDIVYNRKNLSLEQTNIHNFEEKHLEVRKKC